MPASQHFFLQSEPRHEAGGTGEMRPLTRAQPAAWKKDPDIMEFLSSG
jgi:hypothetical protein